MLGEFSKTILESQLVLPSVAQDAGFRWKYPNLEAAMIRAMSQSASRTSAVRSYSSSDFVSAPIESVFAFFSDAQNLESITPPRLRLSMRARPPKMERGVTLEYRLRVHGVALNWKTMISEWEPPHRFVDVQLHGPYALWRHEHTFTPADSGVLTGDKVDYVLPFAPFGNVAAPLVDADVRAIFAFRRVAIAKRFA